MNAPCFPTNPSLAGLQLGVQVFTVSGTYTPSPGLVSLTVECVGGGGGGGGVNVGVGATTAIAPGGGGGAGGYSRKVLPASLVAGGVIVTVGAGGAGSAMGGGVTGGSGTATSFGALCLAYGGAGGNDYVWASSLDVGSPGAGAPPGVGDVAFGGTSGGAGTSLQVASEMLIVAYGGAGGPGPFGGGALLAEAFPPSAANGSNAAATNSGGGGSGGVVNQMPAGATALGGSGATGICIVTEYIGVGVQPPGSGSINVPCWPGAFDGCC